MPRDLVTSVRACPDCGADGRVMDAHQHHRAGQPVYRRGLVCRQCGARWTTYETRGPARSPGDD